MGWGDFIGRINCGVKNKINSQKLLQISGVLICVKGSGVRVSNPFTFHSKVDMLCRQDRWGFSWEISCGGWFLSTAVSQRHFGAMEKGKSALVTKMGMCYWRNRWWYWCMLWYVCTWDPTQSLRNLALALAQPHQRLQTQAIANLSDVFIWGNCPPSQKIFKYPVDFPLLSVGLCQSGWLAWVCFHDIPNWVCMFFFCWKMLKCQAQGSFYGNSDILGFHIS